MLPSGRLRPYLQTLDLDGKVCLGQTHNFPNKLECLLLASLSSLVYCLWAKPNLGGSTSRFVSDIQSVN